MSQNPYQAPAPVETESASAGQPREPFADVHQRSRRVILSGLRLICIGHSLALVVTLLGLLSMLNPFWRLLQSGDKQWAILALFAGISLMVSLLGVAHWCTLPDRKRGAPWLALILQTFSMVGVYGFLLAVFSQEIPWRGMIRLFGASSFAALLTSQAIIALIMRGFAVRRHSGRARMLGELATISYAISGSLVSWAVLGQRSMTNGQVALLSSAWIFVCIAFAAKIRAGRILITDYQPQRDASV